MGESNRKVIIRPDSKDGWWIADGRNLLRATGRIPGVERHRCGIVFHNDIRPDVLYALSSKGYRIVEDTKGTARTESVHPHHGRDYERASCPICSPEHAARNAEVKAAAQLIHKYNRARAIGLDVPWTQALHDATVTISEVVILPTEEDDKLKELELKQLEEDRRVLNEMLNRKVEAPRMPVPR